MILELLFFFVAGEVWEYVDGTGLSIYSVKESSIYFFTFFLSNNSTQRQL